MKDELVDDDALVARSGMRQRRAGGGLPGLTRRGPSRLTGHHDGDDSEEAHSLYRAQAAERRNSPETVKSPSKSLLNGAILKGSRRERPSGRGNTKKRKHKEKKLVTDVTRRSIFGHSIS